MALGPMFIAHFQIKFFPKTPGGAASFCSWNGIWMRTSTSGKTEDKICWAAPPESSFGKSTVVENTEAARACRLQSLERAL